MDRHNTKVPDEKARHINKFKMGKDSEWYNLFNKEDQFKLQPGMDEYMRVKFR